MQRQKEAVPGALALYGGSFDPVHLGHEAVVYGLLRNLDMPVWVMPVGRQPQRQPCFESGAHRKELLEAAFAHEQRVFVSSLELESSGPSFTIDTVAELQRRGAQTIWLCLGADAAMGLPTWHRASALARTVSVYIICRSGWTVDRSVLYRLGFAEQQVAVLELDTPDISSSEVRSRLQTGKNLSGMLGPAVMAKISRYGWYGTPAVIMSGHEET